MAAACYEARKFGIKSAMPIFKEFIQKAVKKKDTRPFKVSENITMVMNYYFDLETIN